MFIPTKDSSTKKLIIEILSSEPPLSLNIICNQLRKRYGINLTYQAVHKAIKELTDEGILQKEKKDYKLSIDWINEIEKYSKKLKESYLKKEKVPYIEVGCGSSVEEDGFNAGIFFLGILLFIVFNFVT